MFSSIGYIICIPFAWLVRLLYTLTGSYGMAIILFTLVVKLIMLPFQMKSKKSMMRMSRMNGKIQEIQKKYANNQAKMQEEMEELRTRIAAIREEASVYASSAREDAVERLYLMRKEAEEKLAAAKAEREERREERAERAEAIRRETEQRLADFREDAIDRLITIRNETEERLDSIRESRKETLAALEQRLEELGEKKRQTIHPKNRLGHFYRRNMLHGNPSVSSTRFAEALKELKERLE